MTTERLHIIHTILYYVYYYVVVLNPGSLLAGYEAFMLLLKGYKLLWKQLPRVFFMSQDCPS